MGIMPEGVVCYNDSRPQRPDMRNVFLLAYAAASVLSAFSATFEIGENDFLLDGKPFVVRCGEVHYARIPRDYWQHRLRMLRAMGCNAVGCYMFWNFHERERGVFKWDGRADAAEFCRMAQKEGLWGILRPGPYSCAEWEGGGAPWWLMGDDGGEKPISMRSSDPRWVVPATNWLHAVGRQLAGLQVTRGGPILMVQVENEYGLHGGDVAYMRALRQAVLDAGFEVPLYACNPPRVMQNGFIPELFQAANFGAEPEQRFEIVRKYQPKGPLMCAEYYPAWFDTWGQAHHPPKRDRDFFGPIDWMLKHGASFSLYMAHGGTSFGGWTGCRNPFVPNVTSYAYEAPINENGRANPSYAKYRERAMRHLNEGESIPDPPADIPTKAYGSVAMSRVASVESLVKSELKMERPQFMEKLGQGFGLVSYERMLAPEDGGLLNVDELHDFGYVFLDRKLIGVLDRRHRGIKPRIYRSKENRPRLLQIVVEAMGRINSSSGMEDRKGLSGRVCLDNTELSGGTARMIPLDPDGEDILGRAKTPASPLAPSVSDSPSLYVGKLDVSDETPSDTFLDMTAWTKGIAWVNGHNLGRFWSIGPQQTLYVPGCWLRKGGNEIVVLDFFGPRGKCEVDFVGKAVLDVLQLDTDFNRVRREHEKFAGGEEVAAGTFPSGDESQVVMFGKGVRGNYFTLQAVTTYDAKNLATISEFAFLDRDGNPMNALDVQITGVDSEEEIREDGVAENAVDGQIEAFWLTSSRTLPHWIEFHVPAKAEVFGFRYTPRQGKDIGRIKDWKFFAR